MANKYRPPVDVYPIGPDFVQQVITKAAEDNHYMIAPTHCVVKDDEIVGAFNIGHTVHWWMNTQCRREDSRFAFMALETLQHQQGLNNYVILCAENSPYKPVAEHFGLHDVGKTNILVRG